MKQRLKKLNGDIDRVLDEHKRKCVAWSEQPSASVRSKINQHFDQAAREIQSLIRKLERELED